MWAKFKSMPSTVKAAITFLSLVVAAASVILPEITIPLLFGVLTAASLIRVMIYFSEGK